MLLGLIPLPRSDEIEPYLDGVIKTKGFVPMHLRHHSPIKNFVGQCKFIDNPVDFAIKLIDARHFGHQSLQKDSHVASILERGKKMDIDHQNEAKRIKTEKTHDNDDDNDL